MRKIFFGLFTFLSFLSPLESQIDSTFQEEFISPVKHNIRLSGSFGELRNNHYHTGIDIKGKNSTSGDSILASMSGFISRIRVQSGSYGKSIYIDHPNGITTVYAHLKQFAPSINALIKQKQKQYASYAIDYYPPTDSLSIGQGNFIGYLGNTGRSTGPHLHFECRITETELPVDPLFYDFGITDSKSPFFQKLLLHELDSSYQILKRIYKDPLVNEVKTASSIIGVGFKGYDQMDGSNNYNGIADIKMYIDNRLSYHCSFDTISFYEMKFINASIDYALKQEGNSTYFMCYKLPSNFIRNIRKAPNNGLVFLDQSANIKIVIMDRAGNRSVSNFNLIKANPSKPEAENSSLKKSNVGHKIRRDHLSVTIPKNGFYKPTNLHVSLSKETNVSHLQIGQLGTACHKYYDVEVSSLSNFDHSKDKLQIYHLNKNGAWTKLGGQTKMDTFTCRINRFGQFKIASDLREPSFEVLQGAKIGRDLLLRIKDDLEVSGLASDISIHCFVDGKWIPIYYKSLNHIMQLPGQYITKDSREIKVVATDNVGNRSEWNYQIKK